MEKNNSYTVVQDAVITIDKLPNDIEKLTLEDKKRLSFGETSSLFTSLSYKGNEYKNCKLSLGISETDGKYNLVPHPTLTDEQFEKRAKDFNLTPNDIDQIKSGSYILKKYKDNALFLYYDKELNNILPKIYGMPRILNYYHLTDNDKLRYLNGKPLEGQVVREGKKYFIGSFHFKKDELGILNTIDVHKKEEITKERAQKLMDLGSKKPLDFDKLSDFDKVLNSIDRYDLRYLKNVANNKGLKQNKSLFEYVYKNKNLNLEQKNTISQMFNFKTKKIDHQKVAQTLKSINHGVDRGTRAGERVMGQMFGDGM